MQHIGPDITCVIHQCTCFYSNPTAPYESAVRCIGQYLFAARDKGVKLQNLNWICMWIHTFILSCTGFIVTYCGCPIHWASKLHIKIALSTTQSEYIALSILWKLIPRWCIVTEIHKQSFISAPLDHKYPIIRSSLLETSKML